MNTSPSGLVCVNLYSKPIILSPPLWLIPIITWFAVVEYVAVVLSVISISVDKLPSLIAFFCEELPGLKLTKVFGSGNNCSSPSAVGKYAFTSKSDTLNGLVASPR